ncbi:MAG: glycogen phosphorylase, partial [Opitutales bacterium]
MPTKKTAAQAPAMLAEKAAGTSSGFKFNTHDTVDGINTSILNHLTYSLARDTRTAKTRDWYLPTSYAVRYRILKAIMHSQARHYDADTRRAYYLSLE